MAEKRGLWLAMGLVIIGAFMHGWLGHSWRGTSGHALGSDDAYISYRYAHNLFDGHGLVFNIGERVEGYSNFLYTLLVTPAFLLGAEYIYGFSITLNTLLAAAAIWVFWGYTHKTLGLIPANMGALILALNPWIWVNAATGLETPLIILITVATWVSVATLCKGPHGGALWTLAGLCVLSILSRVDGFILPIGACLFLALKGRPRSALTLALLIIGVVGLYTMARLAYYDDVIANTYYNKVSGDLIIRIQNGILFLWQYALQTGLLLAFVVLVIRLISTRSLVYFIEETDFAAFFVVMWSAYLIYIGGDVYYERFLVAILPLGLFVVLSWVRPFLTFNWVPWVAVLALAAPPIWFASQDGRFEYDAPKYDFWVETGKFLKEKHPEAVLAIDASGKVPYFSELMTIDMLGLNDKHIGKMAVNDTKFVQGHMKFDPDYVLGRAPDLIAAWFKKDLDFAWGITVERYRESYDIAYVVNPSRKSLGENNIIDVGGMEDETIKSLISEGYLYGILKKR